MRQPQAQSCAAAKGGIAALTHTLAISLAGAVRVNSISPWWIDTDDRVYSAMLDSNRREGGNPMDFANMVMYLRSEMTGFIMGENICIDGGRTRQMMIYRNDYGWKSAESASE